jgi:hypothetical protein
MEGAGQEAQAPAFSASDRIRDSSRAAIGEQEKERPELRQCEPYQVLHQTCREIK